MLTVCMFVCSPITAIQNDAGQFAGKYRSGYWPVPGQAAEWYPPACWQVPFMQAMCTLSKSY